MHIEHIASRLRCECPPVKPLSANEQLSIRENIIGEIHRQEGMRPMSIGAYLGLAFGLLAAIVMISILLPATPGSTVELNEYEKPLARFQYKLGPWDGLPAMQGDQAEFQRDLEAHSRFEF